LGRGNSEEEKKSSNQRLEAYAVKPPKLEELQGGEPQPHVGTRRGKLEELAGGHRIERI